MKSTTNPPGVKLKSRLKDENVTYAKAAQMLECSESMVGHIVTGNKSPGRKLAVKIEENFGVPVSAWP